MKVIVFKEVLSKDAVGIYSLTVLSILGSEDHESYGSSNHPDMP